MLGEANVALIGDSHVRPMSIFPPSVLKVLSVSGGTMSGVNNPVSKSNSYNEISRFLEGGEFKSIVLALGEVDVGFLCLVKGGVSTVGEAKKNVDAAIRAYHSFYKKVSELHPGSRVYVSTVCPPILNDYWIKKSKITLRRNVIFTFEQRVEISKYCNDRIVEIFPHVVDVASRLTLEKNRARFSHVNPVDHHYDSAFYVGAVVGVLAENGIIPPLEVGFFRRLRLFFYDLKSFVR